MKFVKPRQERDPVVIITDIIAAEFLDERAVLTKNKRFSGVRYPLVPRQIVAYLFLLVSVICFLAMTDDTFVKD